METIKSIRDEALALKQKYKDFLSQIATEINSLPDNPKARRLSKNIVIVQLKDMKDNWSAEFYNFKVQYEQVVDFITSDSLTPDQFVARVDKMLREGKIVRHYGSGIWKWKTTGSQHLHPDVVANLKTILQG